jgi:hypothetical protein
LRIEQYAFSDCASLLNVNLPDSLGYVGLCAFLSCGGIKHVNYGDGGNLTDIIIEGGNETLTDAYKTR